MIRLPASPKSNVGTPMMVRSVALARKDSKVTEDFASGMLVRKIPATKEWLVMTLTPRPSLDAARVLKATVATESIVFHRLANKDHHPVSRWVSFPLTSIVFYFQKH